MKVEQENLIKMYKGMLTIRRFEERVSEEFHNGAIPGNICSYIGQEAVAVGVCSNLRLDDRIISNHRGHGHCIAKGADLNRMMAEIYGKKPGFCKGKGGSMHIADFSIGILGADGIVGAGLPIAAGAALAAQLEGTDGIVAPFFGDGACQEGEFHESLNLASIWKLPVLFVCENNLYAVNTSVQYALAVKNISDFAISYMPAITVDGNDVVAVYKVAQKSIARIRAGKGPAFLECKTYHWHGHMESDAIMPDLRPPREIEVWKKRCPIARLKRRLLKEGIFDIHQIEEMDEQVQAVIETAVNFASNSPFPEPRDALKDIS